MRLAVYDVRGRELWRSLWSAREPGEYRLLWDRLDRRGARLARGVYLVRLEAGAVTASRKLVLVHY